jgi:hypothetical protein
MYVFPPSFSGETPRRTSRLAARCGREDIKKVLIPSLRQTFSQLQPQSNISLSPSPNVTFSDMKMREKTKKKKRKTLF